MWVLNQVLMRIKANKQYFSEGRYEIARDNLITMQIAGAAGAVVSAIFFVIAPIIIPSWSITIEYYFIIPILALTFLFSFIYFRRKARINPLTVEIASALFYVLVLADLIALSVFPYPNTPQIFISLCFMFMPTLLILRPVTLVGIMFASEIVFVCLASQYKTAFSLENDIFNTVAAIFFSLIITVITNRLRCRNFGARMRLEHLSQTDALTGLMNKKTFEEYCAACLISQSGEQGVTLLMLDLDDFKRVNDRHGHPVGDELLASMGNILLHSFRQSDLAGRIGGDEFAVLMIGATTEPLLEKKCAELLRRFSDIIIDGVRLRASCSIGAVIDSDVSHPSYSELFRLADEALYKAKREGKGSAVIVKRKTSASEDKK